MQSFEVSGAVRPLYGSLGVTGLIQGVSTSFIIPVPTCLVFKKSTFCAVIKISNSLSTSLAILKNNKAKFKEVL